MQKSFFMKLSLHLNKEHTRTRGKRGRMETGLGIERSERGVRKESAGDGLKVRSLRTKSPFLTDK